MGPRGLTCDATKRRLQSQQQPSRSIWEVVETAGSTRKIEDIREADFRVADRCAGEFEVSQTFRFALTRLDHFAERAPAAILETPLSDRGTLEDFSQ